MILAVLALSISSCGLLDTFQKQKETIPEEPVQISFYVEVPDNTPAGQPIFLNLIDEITGPGFNDQVYEMEALASSENQNRVYIKTLTFSRGQIIKYRYSRGDSFPILEYSNQDKPVRYRTIHAVSQGEIHDLVARWEDTAYNGTPTGQISGIVKDQNSGKPLPGMLISAGGQQTYSTAEGQFLLTDLQPGVHNLVIFAPDGSHLPFQQGAQVASQSNTHVPITLEAAKFVDITFIVDVPPDTRPEQLRLYGSLVQTGNTFSDLPGGISTTADTAPTLIPIGGNQYGIILSLPAGMDFRYKYSLGDGLWNAEHREDGGFYLRGLIIPDQPQEVFDTVHSWRVADMAPITINVSVPDNTPGDEKIYLQLNTYGWGTPLPMWEKDTHTWTYTLYSPLEAFPQFSYRYCRNGDCGKADARETMGESTSGWVISPSNQTTTIEDQVDAWAWLENQPPDAAPRFSDPDPRGNSFITGIDLFPIGKPFNHLQIKTALDNLNEIGPSLVTFSPTWSMIRQDPPMLVLDAQNDLDWYDLEYVFSRLNSNPSRGIALYPQISFPEDPDSWWVSAARDYPWWTHWFDSYSTFILHHASLAESYGCEVLIIGGEWIMPAVPAGKLADGSASGVPADMETRWENLIQEIRERYTGQLAWGMPLPELDDTPYPFLQNMDQIHLFWTPPLVVDSDLTPEGLLTQAAAAVENDLQIFYETWAKSAELELVIHTGYPSAAGGNTGCISTPTENCLPPGELTQPPVDLPTVPLSYAAQSDSIQAVMWAVSQEDWISGLMVNGYYIPAEIHDKSLSIHGKPASGLLSWLFSEMSDGGQEE